MHFRTFFSQGLPYTWGKSNTFECYSCPTAHVTKIVKSVTNLSHSCLHNGHAAKQLLRETRVCITYKTVKLILIDKGLYFSSNAVSHPVIVASNLCCHNRNLTIKTKKMQYYKIVDYFVTNTIYYQVISNI